MKRLGYCSFVLGSRETARYLGMNSATIAPPSTPAPYALNGDLTIRISDQIYELAFTLNFVHAFFSDLILAAVKGGACVNQPFGLVGV